MFRIRHTSECSAPLTYRRSSKAHRTTSRRVHFHTAGRANSAKYRACVGKTPFECLGRATGSRPGSDMRVLRGSSSGSSDWLHAGAKFASGAAAQLYFCAVVSKGIDATNGERRPNERRRRNAAWSIAAPARGRDRRAGILPALPGTRGALPRFLVPARHADSDRGRRGRPIRCRTRRTIWSSTISRNWRSGLGHSLTAGQFRGARGEMSPRIVADSQ